MKKTMTIPDQIHDWYESKAKELSIPTSAIMIIALNDYMKNESTINTMGEMMEELRKQKEIK